MGVGQRSPTFLAPGTAFVKDNFSTDGGGVGDHSGGNASDGECQMKLRSPAIHLLLCGPVSVPGQRVGDLWCRATSMQL